MGSVSTYARPGGPDMGIAAPLTPQRPGSGSSEIALLQELFRAHPDVLLLVDPGGRIVRANPAAVAMLGYAAEELLGLLVDTLVPATARAQHAALRERYGQDPLPRPMGTRMGLTALRKDGSEVNVEIALSPLQGLDQRYVVAALRDISAYPRVQKVLQRAGYSEHLAQLGRVAVDAREPQVVLDQVSAIATGALQADTALIYLLESNLSDFRLASGAGLVAGSAIGSKLPNRPDTLPGFVLHEGHAVKVPDLRHEERFSFPAAYVEAGLTVALAVPLSDRGRTIGAIVVCGRASLHFGDDELHFVESLCNLLATCLQRAQSEDALKHAQRLETVGQLTGGIAHDFNNLLTIIQGSLQVLEEIPSLANDTYGQQLVGAALRASRRGAELTGKLLAFSRRQVLQPDAVDTSAMLHSLADMLRRTLDQSIRIQVDAPAACPPVQADPGQLEAALLNIAVNARDAMLDGGTLRFRARVCNHLPAEVRHNLDDKSADDASFVAISVTDSGSGMTEVVKRRAFEPFFTTKEAGRGTGLGLSTVYGFVTQSSGGVTVDSTLGIGTTMTLYLPRPLDRTASGDADDASSHALPKGLRVLLVEDDSDVRQVVRAFLDGLGCRVTLASSGEQALLAVSGHGPFDLLLSDIALGAGMRGTELARRARHSQPTLAVLLMSGYASELLKADRDAPPGWLQLRKPFTRAELAAAMLRQFTRREPSG